MFGSMKKLGEICQAARFISQSDLGKLLWFCLAFTNEAEKLMDGSVAVVNKQLVDLILAVLEQDFASELERAMNQRAIDDLSKAGGNAGNNPLGPKLRRGDRMPYKTILAIADYIADNWSGSSAMNAIHGSNITRPPSSGGMLPMTGSIIMAEIQEELESFAGDIPQLKDLASLQNRQMVENMKWDTSVENSVKLMNQNLRWPAPHMEMGTAGPSHQIEYRGQGGYSRQTGDHGCFFCGGAHMVRDCSTKDEFIALGWIKIEDKIVKMGDGNWIPKYPENVYHSQKVEDYWKRKGITREIAAAKKATLISSKTTMIQNK
ncbi:hypothetical protein K438DRAFT_1776630 [Mycena galopus ATCC 62051]|nr:hypothetical protein K438DRAFT_1776630 [Mycena galopus ATCC 62051]